MCVLILLKSMIKVIYWCLASNILWFHVLPYIPMLYVFFKHPRLSVFYAFHQRTCFNFTNRIWYNFKINGVCLLYNSGFKLSMKVERTFFSWFFYILCPFFSILFHYREFLEFGSNILWYHAEISIMSMFNHFMWFWKRFPKFLFANYQPWQ